ncbi:YihY/virulence factor BrkB family protein [Olivibacter domesticus]|uniref:Membrane protein n=1 Tax=Olivibacter domesticus TaxID=407022 RepID=A0A1H7L1K4_OLID1|nr:YihY/virulence factor BrkB family protein [Olivibacter domesticus]SEK92265.1 membrane protein [Olivibacter domesticus]
MAKLFTKSSFKNGFKIMKDTFNGFIDENCMKLSASLAYYTVFSLGPMLVLLISLAGIFLGQDAIEGKIFYEIKGLIGSKPALQVQEMIKNLQISGKSTTALVISIITLAVGATSVFSDIQNSINMIWHVKAKPKRGWVKLIKDRLLSSSLIISLGFLLVVSLIVNGVIIALTDRLKIYFPDITVLLLNIINLLISFIIISSLFAIIFKVLPDVKIKWKDVRAGAIFTTIFFIIGRFLIGFYLETSGTESAYGAAGSIILILLWVYYTAAILYFGAVFTRVFAEYKGSAIEPADFAVHIEEKETEKVVDVLPPINKHKS